MGCDPNGYCMKSFLLFIVLICVFSISVMSQTLIAHYQLDGDAIATIGIDGTTVGTSPTTDRFGNPGEAMQFDGVDDYLILPDSLFHNIKPSAFSFWFRTDSIGGLLGQQNRDQLISPTQLVPMLYVDNNGTLRGKYWDGNTTTMAGPTVNDGEWHHVVLTRGTTGQTLYLDSVEVANRTASTLDLNMWWSQLGVAHTSGWINGNNNWFYFDGDMDQVKVFSDNLSAQQVAELFLEGDTLSNGGDPDTLMAFTLDSLCVVCDSTNAGFGKYALNEITGSSNTAIGVSAGQYNNGSGNVFLGYKAGQNSTGSNQLQISNNPDSALIYGDFMSGRVGLGVPDPEARLHVNGNIRMSDSTEFILDNSSAEGGRFKISNDGKVTINTLDPGEYHLAVDGKIKTREVNVTTTEWADHVFGKNYHLMPLSSLRAYIRREGHLPDVPKTEQVMKDGLNIGEFQVTILKKVEELTLYLLDLEERNVNLERENAALLQRLSQLEREISK